MNKFETSRDHRNYLQTNGLIIIQQNTKNALINTAQVYDTSKIQSSPSDLYQSYLNRVQKNKIFCPTIPINP